MGNSLSDTRHQTLTISTFVVQTGNLKVKFYYVRMQTIFASSLLFSVAAYKGGWV